MVETKGPNPIEFENGYVAYEDLPDEQKHLPGESTWGKSDAPADADDLADTESDDDLDLDDDDDDDEKDDLKSSYDEDSDIIFDGSEDLSL